jgi:MFS family permease
MSDTREAGGSFLYGWWIVFVAAVGLFMGYGPVVTFTFGVFLRTLNQEFGWSRGDISQAFSISLFVMSLVFPLVGRLVDRFGARRVIIPSILLFGLGLMSLSLLSGNIWQFYAVYILLGLVGGGTAPVPYSNVLSHWFDKRRGLALGLAMVGLGLGAFVTPSLAQMLIVAYGWRHAYVIFGLMVVIFTVPMVGLFLKETPEMVGLRADGKTAAIKRPQPSTQKVGLSAREARQTQTFWVLVGAFFLMSASVHGCLIHLVALLTDRGISPQLAAAATSLFGAALLFGRVGAGYLLDHFFASSVALFFFCGAALGFLLLWGGVTGTAAFIAAFLVGLGMGAEGDIIAYLISRYFGLRAFGEIYGYAFGAFTLGGVFGPLLMGKGFDTTGSYGLGLGVSVVATLIAAGLMTRLGPYRTWEATIEARVAS